MTAHVHAAPIRVLLIEDNPGDARLITEALRDVAAPSGVPGFELACADRLSTGLARLADGSIDVVLLDLSLPDGSGLTTLARLRAAVPEVPVVVLTGLDDEELAVRAVREGAQDYLVKGQAESALLGRAIRYAVERAADQAERARLLERERAARAEAEAASRVKSQFLTTMSHELRTPLNAIVGYAQLMELGIAGPVTDAQRGYLERLRLSSTHLLGLVDEVLDLAEMGADRLTVVRELAVTGAAVRAALALTLPEATSRGVRVVDGSPVDPGSTYVGYEARVRQILVNLLSNSFKFTG